MGGQPSKPSDQLLPLRGTWIPHNEQESEFHYEVQVGYTDSDKIKKLRSRLNNIRGKGHKARARRTRIRKRIRNLKIRKSLYIAKPVQNRT